MRSPKIHPSSLQQPPIPQPRSNTSHSYSNMCRVIPTTSIQTDRTKRHPRSLPPTTSETSATIFQTVNTLPHDATPAITNPPFPSTFYPIKLNIFLIPFTKPKLGGQKDAPYLIKLMRCSCKSIKNLQLDFILRASIQRKRHHRPPTTITPHISDPVKLRYLK